MIPLRRVPHLFVSQSHSRSFLVLWKRRRLMHFLTIVVPDECYHLYYYLYEPHRYLRHIDIRRHRRRRHNMTFQSIDFVSLDQIGLWSLLLFRRYTCTEINGWLVLYLDY